MANGNAITTQNGPKCTRVKVQLIRTYVGFHPTVAAVSAAMRQAGLPLQELGTF
jgi:hypothetical protein